MTERRADDASRDVTAMAQVLLHAGQGRRERSTGTISGVTSFGLFVTLDGLNIDGLVHVTELGRDYFHFDAVRHALIGERSGRMFQLAGRVRVKVARVDLEQAKIDFTLDEAALDPQAKTALPVRPAIPEPLSRAIVRAVRAPTIARAPSSGRARRTGRAQKNAPRMKRGARCPGSVASG